MNDLMNWDECINQHIRQVRPDPQRVDSITHLALKRYGFIKSLAINHQTVSFIFEGYYEVAKELLVALMLQKGLKSDNHQCLFTFFSREFEFEAEVHLIKQMSFLRNRLNYYGEEIDLDYFKENYKRFEGLVKLLLKLLEK